MPRVPVHHHPCARCGIKTECGGSWEENYDGFPEVICREWHQLGGTTNPEFYCDGCALIVEEEARREYAGGA